MSTRDVNGPETPAVTPPAELRLLDVPTVGATPTLPAAASSTPGISGASARHPAAPTLPDPEPTSLTLLVSKLANEMFAAPPVPSPTADDANPMTSSAPLGHQPSPPALLQPASPIAPPIAPQAAPQTPSSPFDAPLDFTAMLNGADPLDALFTERPLSFPLLDPLSDREPDDAVPQHARVEPGATQVPVVAHEINPTTDHPFGSFGGAALDAHALKREFPILSETVHGKQLIWLDNGATTQKPKTVIDRITYFYEHENSNIHRGAHTLAARATDAYETARASVRRFINAPSVKEIVFVRGATEGINLVAQSWGRRNVNPGDEIVVTLLEHHANIVPWQQLCAERGAKLRVAPVDDRGQVILEEYEKLFNPKTRIAAFTQVSNALGTITPVKEMVDIAHRHGALALVDGAQAVSHMPVDVQALGCDFFVFSGHKVFAPTGIGVVFGRNELLDAMPPWQGGGNMIQDVTFEKTVYQPAPARFEAGTGNIADAVGLGAALDWLTRLGIDRVERYEHELLVYATERLRHVPGLTMIGTAPSKAGVLSFVLAGQKTEEMGARLDKEGIAVRSGHHCAQPILRRFGVEATVRASLAPYNTFEDIDALEAALQRIQEGRVSPR
jgi:cysteine desulfurase/selenocysteine lyase